MAQSIFAENFRPSDILLDRVLNPLRDPDIGSFKPADIIEACGIIPDFFCAACLTLESLEHPMQLEDIAAQMDEAYQYGGFGKYPWKGTVEHDGRYISDSEDPDLLPLARFQYAGFSCFVYDYGVTAIMENMTGRAMVARFD